MKGLGMDDEAAILHIKDEEDYRIPFDEQVEVILQEQVPVFSWTFGIPSHQYIERFKESGTMIGKREIEDDALLIYLKRNMEVYRYSTATYYFLIGPNAILSCIVWLID